MNFICLFLLVFSLWISVNAQENNAECQLPDGLIGECVPTKNCTFGNEDWQFQAYSLPISFWDHIADRDTLCPENDYVCCEPENLFKTNKKPNH